MTPLRSHRRPQPGEDQFRPCRGPRRRRLDRGSRAPRKTWTWSLPSVRSRRRPGLCSQSSHTWRPATRKSWCACKIGTRRRSHRPHQAAVDLSRDRSNTRTPFPTGSRSIASLRWRWRWRRSSPRWSARIGKTMRSIRTRPTSSAWLSKTRTSTKIGSPPGRVGLRRRRNQGLRVGAEGPRRRNPRSLNPHFHQTAPRTATKQPHPRDRLR